MYSQKKKKSFSITITFKYISVFKSVVGLHF